ncbi:MAG: glycosyltransferase [Alphaproteobacteria bacterium]|nr:glycosyltransferase [Alphaproteobacteria bacterium]
MELAVVIPTLNVENSLPRTVKALSLALRMPAIIVADGGSTDGTLAVAGSLGARVVQAARGRGTQLRAGAEAALIRSDWILFLHADTILEPDWLVAVEHHVRDRPDRAGYFGFALDDPAPAARRIERLVRWRCALLALPYGDQGLLISKTLYEAVGGFRSLPLMEDVDLIRRLGRRRVAPLGAVATTSAARYRRGGWWARPMKNLAILMLWFCGVAPATLARLYR